MQRADYTDPAGDELAFDARQRAKAKKLGTRPERWVDRPIRAALFARKFPGRFIYCLLKEKT
jgi:hypothetical protein